MHYPFRKNIITHLFYLSAKDAINASYTLMNNFGINSRSFFNFIAFLSHSILRYCRSQVLLRLKITVACINVKYQKVVFFIHNPFRSIYLLRAKERSDRSLRITTCFLFSGIYDCHKYCILVGQYALFFKWYRCNHVRKYLNQQMKGFTKSLFHGGTLSLVLVVGPEATVCTLRGVGCRGGGGKSNNFPGQS